METRARGVRRTPALLATAAGAMLLIAAWAVLANPYASLLSIPCPFHAVTGFDCPGCGLQRASWSLLHGDIRAAFRANPLVFVVLPLLAVVFTQTLRQWITGVEARRRDMPAPVVVALVAAVLAFGVLRNL